MRGGNREREGVRDMKVEASAIQLQNG